MIHLVHLIKVLTSHPKKKKKTLLSVYVLYMYGIINFKEKESLV